MRRNRYSIVTDSCHVSVPDSDQSIAGDRQQTLLVKVVHPLERSEMLVSFLFLRFLSTLEQSVNRTTTEFRLGPIFDYISVEIRLQRVSKRGSQNPFVVDSRDA